MSKAPRLTRAQREQHPCPRCSAQAGEPCHDYRGHTMAPHSGRGTPEVIDRKDARKAEALNAKARAEYGPLFAHLADEEVKPVTPADLAAKRLAAVRAGDGQGPGDHAARIGLTHITLRYMRRVAAELIGQEAEAELWEHCERIFGQNRQYIRDRYCDALCTTSPIVLAYRIEERPEWVHPTYNREGRRAVPAITWPPAGYVPVMDREEFNERFGCLPEQFWWKPEAPQDEPAQAQDLFARCFPTLNTTRS